MIFSGFLCLFEIGATFRSFPVEAFVMSLAELPERSGLSDIKLLDNIKNRNS